MNVRTLIFSFPLVEDKKKLALPGAWLGLLAGVLGLWTIAMAIRARSRVALPAGTLFGLLLTGLAAAGLAAFIMSWGLSPL